LLLAISAYQATRLTRKILRNFPRNTIQAIRQVLAKYCNLDGSKLGIILYTARQTQRIMPGNKSSMLAKLICRASGAGKGKAKEIRTATDQNKGRESLLVYHECCTNPYRIADRLSNSSLLNLPRVGDCKPTLETQLFRLREALCQ
jgi:hypothetical protein